MARDGRYAENAGAIFGYGHGRPVCRPAGAPGTCGHFPHPCGAEMQEHSGRPRCARENARSVRYRRRMTTQPLHIVILAAGEGKRMKSALPKVLLPLAGKPMLTHVIATARTLGAAKI